MSTDKIDSIIVLIAGLLGSVTKWALFAFFLELYFRWRGYL